MKKWLMVVTVVGLALMAVMPVAAQEDEPTIVEIALAVNADTGEFSTLIAALVAADLVDALNGKRQFTVFAPTDAAFAELGLTAENIGDVPTDALTNILLYHVSPGERFAEDVFAGNRVRMLNKQFTFPTLQDDTPFINESQIITPNVDAANGVIHIIDAVLLPE